MKRAVAMTFGLIALFAALPAHAAAIDIQVLDAKYTVAIAFGYPYDLTANPLAAPVSDAQVIDGFASAAANADWLAVAASSQSEWQFTRPPDPIGVSSQAEFALTFAPLADGVATMVVGSAACGAVSSNFGCDPYGSMWYGPYSSGFASLVDVTANEEMWRYAFGHGSCCVVDLPASGTILSNDDMVNGAFLMPTAFEASHVYSLDLFVVGDSFQDDTAAGVQVSGLTRVPEPPSVVLLGTSVVLMATCRRRFARRR